MSKRGGFPGMGGGFGGMNINQLMKEAKKMQADMEKSQEELQAKEFESTAGGGAVSVKVFRLKTNIRTKAKQGSCYPRRCRNVTRFNNNLCK